MPTVTDGVHPVDAVVDWEFAARTAARVGGSGPDVTPAEAAAVVAALRSAAARAHPHVIGVTGLETAQPSDVLVVDRPGWARANVAAFRTLLAPVVAESYRRRGTAPGGGVSAIGSRITGAEVGVLLGALSSRVLGQYDPFADPGRLLLVAPTIVAVERELGVEPDDFRLWVCLHEETHRVQFTATPWLAGHLQTEVRSLVGDLMIEPTQLAERVSAAVRALPEVLRGGRDRGAPGTGGAGEPGPSSGVPLLDAIQTPEQRRRLAGITAVMSLLEGHADVVMDDVGPAVVPSVTTIRQRFSRRRAGRGLVDQVLRRLMGLEAKARQYADGARFVRAVTQQVGMGGFNAVWTSPDTLPVAAEIADPAAWVRRVHG